MRGGRAVVVVSGGAAVSPFTTPSAACAGGQPAGSTDSALRAALLGAGFRVFTSPANIGQRPVVEDRDFAGFTDPPEVLPAELTVDAVGPIDTAGEHLGRFLAWLAEREALATVDLVGHSMGGLFSRAAIRELQRAGHPLRIGSLTTLGTPWTGSYAADIANGHLPFAATCGDAGTETIVREFTELHRTASTGAGEQVTAHYLAGADGWNERQRGVLDGIPVTIVGGDHFRLAAGGPDAWPHDGLVQLASATAADVSPAVVQPREVRVLPDVHSIFFAEQFGLPWQHGLTWDPAAHSIVVAALQAAG